jgi:uncharacterized protein
MTFHAGEIAVQARAGVSEEATNLKRLIGNALKPAAESFLTTQHLAIAGSVDSQEKVWASLLVGDPGFIEVLNPHALNIRSLPVAGDPLYQNVPNHSKIGILAIDLTNRKRLRLNGLAQLQINATQALRSGTGSLTIQLQEVFFNCPKYIQTRHLTEHKQESANEAEIFSRIALNDRDRQWIIGADTFFISSFYAETGVDTSHRGGFPGFVRVLSPNQLAFPDYDGNNMFQTLGNLTVNPRIGLLFVDFEQGHTLQLTGTANVIWEREKFAQIPGARRLIEFTIEQILETRNATSFRWQFEEYSPANPA